MVCLMTKRRAQSVAFNLSNPEGFQSPIDSKIATAGQIISLDPVGPISPLSLGGFSLMWCVYDIGSSYMWVYFSKSKEATVIVQILELVIADLIFFGKICSDFENEAGDSEQAHGCRRFRSFRAFPFCLW